ncbi:MAG: NUDIX domain-containing protein, partial [Rhodospirillaceae bacterium]|nr:NUDIX domain-containing protein [Rhodospirillaceae bacterium]
MNTPPTYPKPVVGVGVVIVKDADVLMIKRGQPPREREWSIPGGHQELGET